METVDRGYHVHMAVWEAAVGQILPCLQEGGNIYDVQSMIPTLLPLLRIMTRPLIMPHSMKVFSVKTFVNYPETVKVFSRKRFPLYGIRTLFYSIVNAMLPWKDVVS